MSTMVEFQGKMIPVESVQGGPPPKVGEDIYVPSQFYISRGEDDFQGGLCEVSKVYASMSAGAPTWFVEVKERPGHGHNWEIHHAKQAEYKERYGMERGRPDPDMDPSANGGWI